MRLFMLSFVIVLNVLAAGVATAQEGFENLPPLPESAMDENAPIRMTPDGPAVIKLNQDAASVIIGNPAQATAILENPRMIMLIPQQPGATKIIALDRNGQAILNKHILVGGGRTGFIRVNRACGTTKNAACKPVAMYYCPDRCYETTVPQPGSEAAVATQSGAGGNGAQYDDAPAPSESVTDVTPIEQAPVDQQDVVE